MFGRVFWSIMCERPHMSRNTFCWPSRSPSRCTFTGSAAGSWFFPPESFAWALPVWTNGTSPSFPAEVPRSVTFSSTPPAAWPAYMRPELSAGSEADPFSAPFLWKTPEKKLLKDLPTGIRAVHRTKLRLRDAGGRSRRNFPAEIFGK